jgi:hypothetical protein
MFLIALLLVIEVFTILVLKKHFLVNSEKRFYISLSASLFLSAWLWISLIRVITGKGYFDDPENITARMNLNFLLSAVVAPRAILILMHFSGSVFKSRKGGNPRWITRAGFVSFMIIFLTVAWGHQHGRFNFKTEEVHVKLPGLPSGLNGLRVVHLSDLHLAGFHGHHDMLEKIINIVNLLEPDIIANTGDFISYGWREFDRCDTILSKARSRYGNFAILGNHDIGSYIPNSSLTDNEKNTAEMIKLIEASGYRLLKDNNVTIIINGCKVALIGVTTAGKHPAMIHGDIAKAGQGTGLVDFKILLAHDPNQWAIDVAGKTDINLTLSGHTHGMQLGILTRKVKWSPARRYYPHWHGLYSKGSQYHYVNRGLGVLAVPFRLWMPPEITLLILENE